MQIRGGGRFGKYGDLKRKEKIRRNQLTQKGSSISSLVQGGKKAPKQPEKGSTKK